MSSDNVLVEAMKQQYDDALELLEDTIRSFPEADWKGSQGEFRPDAMSLHALQALDFHLFSSDDNLETWTFRFTKHAWDIAEWSAEATEMPERAEILTYLQDLKSGVFDLLCNKADADLSQPCATEGWYGKTLLGRLVYTLRHTMHHQGQLAILRHYAGEKKDTWR